MKGVSFNKTIFLFTAEYPYGNKSETFLETEINYLAKGFKNVCIVPSKKSKYKRDVPSNVIVIDNYSNLTFTKSDKLLNLFKNPSLFLAIFYSEIQNKGLKKVIRNFKELLDHFTQQLIIATQIENDNSINHKDAILYDYWFCNLTLALAILKNKNPDFKLLSRAHGYDLYDERWGDIGVPFRQFKLQKLDQLFCISKKGQEYFKSKVPIKLHSKIENSYLGVEKHSVNDNHTVKGLKTIVSCSSLLAFKNVSGIVDLLKKANQPLHWIHFGDGPEREILLQKVKALPSNINFELKGHVDNDKIIHFYQNNFVDLFISLSTSEGLPVSMMEAISFGIPILANNVGGISELVVNEITGFLIEPDTEINTKVDIFGKAIRFEFDPNIIVNFYNKNFNAENNYKDFIQRIKNVD